MSGGRIADVINQKLIKNKKFDKNGKQLKISKSQVNRILQNSKLVLRKIERRRK